MPAPSYIGGLMLAANGGWFVVAFIILVFVALALVIRR